MLTDVWTGTVPTRKTTVLQSNSSVQLFISVGSPLAALMLLSVVVLCLMGKTQSNNPKCEGGVGVGWRKFRLEISKIHRKTEKPAGLPKGM